MALTLTLNIEGACYEITVKRPLCKHKTRRHHAATAILSSQRRAVRRRTNLAGVEVAVYRKPLTSGPLFGFIGCIHPAVMSTGL